MSNIKPLYGVYKTPLGQLRSQYYSPKPQAKEGNINWLPENIKKERKKNV